MGDRHEADVGAVPSGGPAASGPHEREADRRDSARFAVPLLVRDLGIGGSFEPRTGNLSLGGVWFDGLHPPAGTRVEVRFLLPGFGQEIRATGEVLRVTRDGPRFGAHVKFVDIPVDAELAVARFLQRG